MRRLNLITSILLLILIFCNCTVEKRLYTKGWNIQRLQSNNINSRAKNQNETFFREGEPINDSAYTTNDLAMVSNPDQQTETIANIDEYNTLKIHSISLNNFNSSTSKLAKEVKENYSSKAIKKDRTEHKKQLTSKQKKVLSILTLIFSHFSLNLLIVILIIDIYALVYASFLILPTATMAIIFGIKAIRKSKDLTLTLKIFLIIALLIAAFALITSLTLLLLAIFL